MENFKVVMLGPRGVGKTTLLAATWERFTAGLFEQTRLNLRPGEDTGDQLEERLEELRTLPGEVKDRTLTLDMVDREGIMATIAPNYYDFTLGAGEEDPEIELEFFDYPGEWITKQGRTVRENVREAHAVMIAIDTPAMMESISRDGWDWLHAQHNKPSRIAEALRVYRTSKTPRLVLFVPVRCEAYLGSLDESKELALRVKDSYAEAFRVLESNAGNIAVVITPVQTIGTLQFYDIQAKSDPQNEASNSDYTFVFHKKRATDNYRPQDTEQPLAYLMRFMLHQLITGRQAAVKEDVTGEWGPDSIVGGFLAWVVNAFSDWDFKNAAQSFANKTREDPPFEIVQGRSLLG